MIGPCLITFHHKCILKNLLLFFKILMFFFKKFLVLVLLSVNIVFVDASEGFLILLSSEGLKNRWPRKPVDKGDASRKTAKQCSALRERFGDYMLPGHVLGVGELPKRKKTTFFRSRHREAPGVLSGSR